MTAVEVFLWGLGGSVAVEILDISRVYYKSSISLPARYRLWHFYVVRIILASIGGGLAIAYAIDKPLLAANIGAATPLLIDALSSGVKDEPPR